MGAGRRADLTRIAFLKNVLLDCEIVVDDERAASLEAHRRFVDAVALRNHAFEELARAIEAVA